MEEVHFFLKKTIKLYDHPKRFPTIFVNGNWHLKTTSLSIILVLNKHFFEAYFVDINTGKNVCNSLLLHSFIVLGINT